MSTRRTAIGILTRVEREQAWAAPLIEQARLEEREARFLRTLVMSVLRWQSQLDYVIEQLSGRPVRKIQPPLVRVLRLGLAQLLYTDVSPHAAVHETVSLCTGTLARGRGLVNAILRRASREDVRALIPSGDSAADVAVRLGHPEWLIRRWISNFGTERTIAVASANQELSHADLLINTTRTTPDAVKAALLDRGVTVRDGVIYGDVVSIEGSVAAAGGLLAAGDVYPMDEGSVAVARCLQVSPGDRVIDLTAAPGGKSVVLALAGAEVVSNDISMARLNVLRATHARVSPAAAKLVVGDGTRPPFRGRVQRVLLDAPCSATGIVRRSPEIRWRLTEQDLSPFAALQSDLLRSALDLAEEEIVYSTCSLEAEENDHVVEEVLGRHSEWELAPAVTDDSPLRAFLDGMILRLTPEGGTDGFTVHRLVRSRR